jgi:uncharacterized protein YjbJ (UPF0337 family)
MATPEFNDEWTIIKGKLRRRWDKLTETDLAWVDGQRRELEARIVDRTGETCEAVTQALDLAFKESSFLGSSPLRV